MIHPAGPARFDREIGIAFAKHRQERAERRVPVCLTNAWQRMPRFARPVPDCDLVLIRLSAMLIALK